MSVPYHTLDLDEKLSYKQDKAAGNLIIEGDNLPALKSLLPQYTGKIKCIYIDPPYNTGQENWVYNDNVNSPLIKEWIGKEVNKDDLTKHDKWLTMMTPRVKILKELLDDDGIFFTSIDDNEVHYFRCLLDEVFGESNFLTQIAWQKVYSPKNQSRYFSNDHEYILVYARNIENAEINLLPRTEEMDARYKNPDSDPRGPWQSGDLISNEERKNGHFIVKSPITKKEFDSPVGKHWAYSKENLEELISDNKVWFGKDGNSFPRIKQFLSEVKQGRKASNLLLHREVGHTDEAIKEVKSIFSDKDKATFDTPKPTRLIKTLIRLACNEGIVLDAFAGSGTTAQAVLELNEEDEGNRKYILIQMPENSEKDPNKNISRDITRERVVKVIDKKLKNKDVGFEYRRVGQPIDAETILSGQLPTYKELAKYVYYLATGQSPKDKDIDEKKYLAGKVDHTEVYLLYTPDMEELKKMAITFEWAKEISKGNNNKKIIYAPACFMDDEYLEQFNIKFVSIPYNLFERQQ